MKHLQMRVIDAKMTGNVLTAELDNCPYKEGEEVQLDTEKLRVVGTIFWKLGKTIKIRVKNNEIFTKTRN